MTDDLSHLTDERLRRILREMLRTNSDYRGRYSLISRVLESEARSAERSVISRQEVAAVYAPVYTAIAELDDATDRGTESWVAVLLQRAEAECGLYRETDPTTPSDLADWVDPTGTLDTRSLAYLRESFSRVTDATTLPAFDWEAQWFAGLHAAADGDIEDDYPARDATHLDWAFRVHENSALASDEGLTPGITEYVGHLMSRAATLGRQTVGMFAELYRENVVMHTGVETPLALTRMELEVVGRIRAIVTPKEQTQRVKAYVAARYHDLNEAAKMTENEQPGLVELAALVPTLEALDGEPEVYREVRNREAPLERWRLHPGAAARWLHGRRRTPNLYWKLSEAVHGGGIIKESWFANSEAFGVKLVHRCAETLRSELVELNSAYLRYATYGRMNAG